MNAKTDAPLPNAITAVQPQWHCWAAAEHFCDSCNSRIGARYREIARRKFIEHAAAGLESMGLDAFMDRLKIELSGMNAPNAKRKENMAEGEAVIRAIASAKAAGAKPF